MRPESKGMTMKPILGLAAAGLLLASAAYGQSTPAPAPGTTTAAPGNPSAASPTTGKVVEGVTVVGKRLPTRSCGSRDKDCIDTVVAELKARYPHELKMWCAQVKERAAMNTLMFMEVDMDRPLTANTSTYEPPPVTKIACAPDKKP
jgi:hypothetical protein